MGCGVGYRFFFVAVSRLVRISEFGCFLGNSLRRKWRVMYVFRRFGGFGFGDVEVILRIL